MANELRPSSRGLSVGLLIVAIGLVFLLDQEGIVSADHMFSYFWPAVFIFFGLEAALCRDGGNKRIFGIVITAIGVLLLLSRFGFLHFRIGFEIIWPVMLIWAGVWIIVRAFRLGGGHVNGFEWLGTWVTRLHQGGTDPMESQFDLVAVFGGVKRRITSQAFRGGSVMTFCGGFHIDLRQANIEGESATINASSCMGGGEIRVPHTWIVDMQGLPLFGGFVDETDQAEETDPAKRKRLYVKGTALMGGVVVKN